MSCYASLLNLKASWSMVKELLAEEVSLTLNRSGFSESDMAGDGRIPYQTLILYFSCAIIVTS